MCAQELSFCEAVAIVLLIKQAEDGIGALLTCFLDVFLNE